MSELYDLLFFEYGTARVLGVIVVGLYVSALLLRKLVVRYWKDDDKEFVDPCPFADPRGSAAQVRAWEKLEENEERRD